jgi:hypothetical protein
VLDSRRDDGPPNATMSPEASPDPSAPTGAMVAFARDAG